MTKSSKKVNSSKGIKNESPKKGGLTRLVTPGSPSKGQPNNNPFSLFVIPMKQGVSTAYATTYNNPQRSAFVYPIVQHLEANLTIATFHRWV